ncbi:hypothetical protein CQW23_22029 [Capsicum baccatum]|uniref:Uncharacterized protein n=1 Tax=Capsicum baccatum TaxID=33114 RepID=A0A2G2VZQ1_CAPBA|nr:hypothetical protein CQW23_22029 [Capsicum baccatum]
MMNSGVSGNSMSSSSAQGNNSSNNAQSPGLKTYFKTPEGRYKLHYEKTHPAGLLHYAHGKTVTQMVKDWIFELNFRRGLASMVNFNFSDLKDVQDWIELIFRRGLANMVNLNSSDLKDVQDWIELIFRRGLANIG